MLLLHLATSLKSTSTSINRKVSRIMGFSFLPPPSIQERESRAVRTSINCLCKLLIAGFPKTRGNATRAEFVSRSRAGLTSTNIGFILRYKVFGLLSRGCGFCWHCCTSYSLLTSAARKLRLKNRIKCRLCV